MKSLPTFHNDITTVPTAVAVPVSFTDQVNLDGMADAEGYRAIVDPNNNNVFSILSTKYKIMQHTEVLEKVEDSIAKHPEYGTPKRMITTVNGGARLRAKYTFPDIEVPIKDSKDLVNPQLEIRNGYDGMWGFGCLFGAFRLVCSNGLVIGEAVMQFKKKHYNPAQQFLMTDMLENSLEQFSMQTELWRGWVDNVLDVKQVENTLESMQLRQKERNEIEELSETHSHATVNTPDISQWILFNILTQYITHHVKSVQRQVELETRLRKVM